MRVGRTTAAVDTDSLCDLFVIAGDHDAEMLENILDAYSLVELTPPHPPIS